MVSVALLIVLVAAHGRLVPTPMQTKNRRTVFVEGY
jgi:hypothetical protein